MVPDISEPVLLHLDALGVEIPDAPAVTQDAQGFMAQLLHAAAESETALDAKDPHALLTSLTQVVFAASAVMQMCGLDFDAAWDETTRSLAEAREGLTQYPRDAAGQPIFPADWKPPRFAFVKPQGSSA